MTDQDTLLMVAAGLLAVWWLVKHPGAAKGIGLVLLVGLVCFGIAQAQTHARWHHRRGYRQGHHRRRRGWYSH
jgi:hypothetical protein